MKGLDNLFPHRTQPAQPWDRELVLNTLTQKPFEPLATCDFRTLTMKVLFLTAITSARRVGELAALSALPPYTLFIDQGVILRPQPTFLPKVNSKFHINEPIVLPTFYPKPHISAEQARLHTLDARRTLAFYIDRTRSIRKTNNLFVSTADRSKGQPLSAQRISSIIVNCIKECYTLRSRPLLQNPTAHSTCAVAASTAFLKGVPLKDICRAATWSSNFTFAKHYAIPNLHLPEGAVARTVLSTATVR